LGEETAIVQAILSGGIGNQMFQYAAARRFALRADCELLLAPVPPARGELHTKYRLRHFNIAGRDIPIGRVSAAHAPLPQKALRRLVPALFPPEKTPPELIRELVIFDFGSASMAGKLTETDCLLFNPEMMKPRKNVRLWGYWQNERYFADIAPLIKQEFQLKSGLDRRSQACVAMIKTGPSAFLHVRRGDYLAVRNINRLGVCPPGYYEAGIALLRERHGNDLKIFVFSNDADWVRANKIGGDDAIIIDWNGQAPQNDLMLMRACQHAIIANSSFSWWGAWLGEWPGQTVIAPRVWFKVVPEYRDIVPERWLRL